MSKILFNLTAGVTTAFIVTILAMFAMLNGDSNWPINRWFNVYGAVVLTVEVVSIGVFGMLAMIADRQETLRETRVKARSAANLSHTPEVTISGSESNSPLFKSEPKSERE